MRYSKVRDVKSPEYGTSGSAGIDFFVPNDFGPVILTQNSDVLIPSGIKMNIPEGYMLLGADKSGIVISDLAKMKRGLKKNPMERSEGAILIIGAKIIDEDYQGEIHIHVINVGQGYTVIRPGMKIAQFILTPVRRAELEEVPEQSLFPLATGRGQGMASSTGIY